MAATLLDRAPAGYRQTRLQTCVRTEQGLLMARKRKTAESSGNEAALTDKSSSGYEELKSAHVVDFISGKHVKATLEEVEAVQVFSRRLVEDYGYPKGHLLTRPQYRVRKRPSDDAKAYPVDIAVFKSEKQLEDELYLTRLRLRPVRGSRIGARAESSYGLCTWRPVERAWRRWRLGTR